MDLKISSVVQWFNRIYLGGIPQLIRDETAFLAFICMLTGIDALAGYREPNKSGPGQAGPRFTEFVTSYFPSEYNEFAADLWDFRNGMAHGFSPRRFALTHHNGQLHLRKTKDGATILNAEDFFSALVIAARSYFRDLDNSPTLQAGFLERIQSKSGGNISVGFVDVVETSG